MHTRRLIGGVRLAPVVAVAMLLVTVPASASSGRARSESAPRAATTPFAGSPSVADARRQVGEIRAAIETGRLAEVLQASGIGGTFALDTVGATNAPSSPVAELSEVIADASTLIGRVVPAHVNHQQRLTEGIRAEHEGRTLPALFDPADQPVVARGAARVAAAIDTALPRLAAIAAPDAPAGRVDGCDIVDQSPALCVAGLGDNAITKDYALVVDLGGADLHTHSAGGADPLGNGLPVAVTIDLGGNDRYDAPVPTESGSWISQGGGYLGGAGFLVDAGGDDTYRIVTNQPYAFSMGQGKAHAGGFGLLSDLAGNDSYEISATGEGIVAAFGQADGGGVGGILLDGSGNDRYAIRATATGFALNPFGYYDPPVSAALGMGVGWQTLIVAQGPFFDLTVGTYGAGVFSDGGGDDVLDVAASIHDPKEDEKQERAYFPPEALAWGVGLGNPLMPGLAIFGRGATDISVSATAAGPQASAIARGIGNGMGGYGVVSDLGGNDVRRMSAHVSVERDRVVGVECDCEEPVISTVSNPATLSGMGHATESGLGLLDDGGGEDRYLASASNSVESRFHDERSNGSAATGSSSAGRVRVTVQGVGEDGGVGELADAAGNDRYEATASTASRATSISGGTAPHPKAEAVAGSSTLLSQAASRLNGIGRLIDSGGSDVYATSSATSAEANPPTAAVPGAVTAGVLASADQGSWSLFVDADGGLPDSFSTSPSVAACTGTRGEGAWVDCGGAGTGFVA